MSAAPQQASKPSEPISRAAIVAEAIGWIGTPYCHQASKRGVGADCLGLVIGVWNGLAPVPLTLARNDQRSWAHHADGEPLLDGLRQFLSEKQAAASAPGDVIALRWRSKWPASHLAIIADETTIIHAYEGGQVVRSNLAPWSHHIATCFAFPDHFPA